MRSVSRRGAIVGAMKTGAYAAPAILSVSLAAPVGAVSPAPTATVTFTLAGSNEIVHGTGFPPSNVFYMVIYTAAGDVVGLNNYPRVVTTDAAGTFTLTLTAYGHLGSAPAIVNGGNIFVQRENIR